MKMICPQQATRRPIKMMKLLLPLLAFPLVSLAQTAGAPAPVTSDEVRGLIREFIEENPQVILDSLSAYDRQQRLAEAAALVRPHSPTLGPVDAPVTIVEFSEFQCPFCQRAQGTLETLRERYGQQVRFVYKHLPLDFHAQAEPAALASQAAHNQGKFWEYSAKLWENQNRLGNRLYTQVAEEVGLDIAQFELDRTAASTRQALALDLQDAARIGARGTPYFLINGQVLNGARPLNDFVAVIEQALARTE